MSDLKSLQRLAERERSALTDFIRRLRQFDSDAIHAVWVFGSTALQMNRQANAAFHQLVNKKAIDCCCLGRLKPRRRQLKLP